MGAEKTQRIVYPFKIDKQKYNVEVLIFEDGNHQAIGYKPVPTQEIREKINEKVAKFVAFISSIKSKGKLPNGRPY
jgi:hypothetical protein